MRRVLLAVLLFVVAVTARHGLAQPPLPQTCTPGSASAPAAPGVADADLYCIDLLPAKDIESASGIARLVPPSSPFGVAVSPAGEMQYDVDFTLRDLPPVRSLGAFTTYLAWATTPQLQPVIKLGEVSTGTVRLGRVPFDRFLVLVTAEASSGSSSPAGRLVLRGTSASVRMQPHDLAFLLAGLLDSRETNAPEHRHDPHAAPASTPGGWTPPPMHPQASMPPAFMTLRPDVASYRPADRADIPLARPRELIRLADEGTLTLVAAPVHRVLFGRTITMLGFNGQYPGPLIQVEQASTINVRFVNQTDFSTAIHWHGLRLDNQFDGVPHVTQEPVPPGGSYDYRVFFRDAGIYWYHPHHREDALQDLGLYGNLLVRSRAPDYFTPANREEILMLDDLLVSEAGPVGYGLEAPTHALMGRFGNALLVNGEPKWEARVRRGDVVRMFLTNVSSTRVFNVSFEVQRAKFDVRSAKSEVRRGKFDVRSASAEFGVQGASAKSGIRSAESAVRTAGQKPAVQAGPVRMKVVASDLGRYEREQWIDNVTIAPAERYVVDVRFAEAGEVALVNRVRAIDHIMARFFEDRHVLGTVHVTNEPATPDHAATFGTLRRNTTVSAEIDAYRTQFRRPVDHELTVTLHAGDLPFPMRPLLNLESVYRNPVEWSGTMPEMDWIVTGRHVRWILRDRATGRENMDIDWRFRVGDVVKVRLVNDRSALHAMQHPIHIHGQRFLVLSTNGVANENLVWKDTVLLPTGFVTDVLLEITNPGKWMLHCHVAEHIETGMRMVFEVEK